MKDETISNSDSENSEPVRTDGGSAGAEQSPAVSDTTMSEPTQASEPGPTDIDWAAIKPEQDDVVSIVNSGVADEHPLDDNDIQHEKERIRRIEVPDFVLKPARSESHGNFDRARDLLCELICSNLAQYLGLPVIWQVPMDSTGDTPSLVGEKIDEDDVPVDPARYANGDALSKICVFEEWVMNSDIRGRHFCGVETANGWEFRVIDHGHSLHHPNDIEGPNDVEDHANITKSVGHAAYPFQSADDVEDGITVVKNVTEAEISNVLDRTFQELREMDTTDEDFVTLLDEAEEHKETIRRILVTRQDNIRDIVEDRFR